MPDLVDQADDWICMQMSRAERHSHWWKELRALYQDGLVGDLSNVHTIEFS